MIRITKTENGTVQGQPAADPRITAFRGIPFASPPVGDFRWRAPQPAKNWDGVLEAYNFAPIGMQAVPGLDKENIYTREWNVDPEIPMSEDCLYLNIWTPANEIDEKLPVFVWYFGGALQFGNTAEMEFNGERIARRGIVVVTVNYRLNVFGFFAHPEITAEAPDFPANFGNLDQKFATEWVKRNIAAFGGDPGNITIGGQSAGGGSVLTQITSPLTKGLFNKAIVQSGLILDPYDNIKLGFAQTLAEAEKEGQAFFDYLGVKSLKEARELDAVYLRDKNLSYGKWWLNVIDGNYITDSAINILFQNKQHKIPLLMGYTSNEFLTAPNAASAKELEDFAKRKYGDRAQEFLELCKDSDIKELIRKATASPVETGIRAVYALLNEKNKDLENYFYYFDAHIPGEDNPGAFHSVDLWFTFETLASCWRPFKGAHYDLARVMCNYWSNFIKSGDPNGNDADGAPMPEWKPYSQGGYPMVFKDKPAMGTSEPDKLTCFLIDQYLTKL